MEFEFYTVAGVIIAGRYTNVIHVSLNLLVAGIVCCAIFSDIYYRPVKLKRHIQFVFFFWSLFPPPQDPMDRTQW